MHMTQTTQTNNTHFEDMRPKYQIIVSTIVQYVSLTCHLSSTQLVI